MTLLSDLQACSATMVCLGLFTCSFSSVAMVWARGCAISLLCQIELQQLHLRKIETNLTAKVIRAVVLQFRESDHRVRHTPQPDKLGRG